MLTAGENARCWEDAMTRDRYRKTAYTHVEYSLDDLNRVIYTATKTKGKYMTVLLGGRPVVLRRETAVEEYLLECCGWVKPC